MSILVRNLWSTVRHITGAAFTDELFYPDSFGLAGIRTEIAECGRGDVGWRICRCDSPAKIVILLHQR